MTYISSTVTLHRKPKDGASAPTVAISASCNNTVSTQSDKSYIEVSGKKVTTGTYYRLTWNEEKNNYDRTMYSGALPTYLRGFAFYFLNANNLALRSVDFFDTYEEDANKRAKMYVIMKNVVNWYFDNYPDTILLVTSSDATSCEQPLRDVFNSVGGSLTDTYVRQRRRHYFATNLGNVQSGQAYEEISNDPTQKIVTFNVNLGEGIILQGAAGNDGDNGNTPYIGENGNWWINGVDTETPAKPDDPNIWTIGTDGYWYLNGIRQDGMKAIGEDGNHGRSVITSYAFRRSATRLTTAPTGGSFASPHPTTTGWSDGVPEGTNPVYMSSRVFTSDGLSPQQTSWSKPTLLADTADIDIEYTYVTENPGTPSTVPGIWHNDARADDVWMAVRKKVGGTWSSWQVLKIKGEKGDTPTIDPVTKKWIINGQPTDYSAVGDDGHSPYISRNTGTWWEYDPALQPDPLPEGEQAGYHDTGIRAEGTPGTDSITLQATSSVIAFPTINGKIAQGATYRDVNISAYHGTVPAVISGITTNWNAATMPFTVTIINSAKVVRISVTADASWTRDSMLNITATIADGKGGTVQRTIAVNVVGSAQGQTVTGPAGASICKIEEYYLANTGTKPSPNDRNWSTTHVEPSAAKPYVWNKEIIYVTGGDYGESVVPLNADDPDIHLCCTFAEGIISHTSTYLATTKPSVTKDEVTMTLAEAMAIFNATNRYFWNYEEVVYKSGRIATSLRLLAVWGAAGAKGDKGDPGDKGDKGDDGDKGDPGVDALDIYLTSENVTFNKRGDQVYVYIDVWQGGNRIPSNIHDIENGYGISSIGTSLFNGAVLASFGADEIGRFYFVFYCLSTTPTAIEGQTLNFDVIYNGRTIRRTLFFHYIVNGERGYTGVSVRRSEWRVGVDYRNDQDSESTSTTPQYLDYVSVTNLVTKTAEWYLARPAHNGVTSSAENKPSGNGNEYWQKVDDYKNGFRTPFADIQTALVEFLNVSQITLNDGSGKIYGAFGTPNDQSHTPLWFGGDRPDSAVTAFRDDGSAVLANGNLTYDADGNVQMSGKIMTYDSVHRLVSSYNENGDGLITYYYADLEEVISDMVDMVTGQHTITYKRVKMKEDVFTYDEKGNIYGMQTRYYGRDGNLQWYVNEMGQSHTVESYWDFYDIGEEGCTWQPDGGAVITDIKRIAIYLNPVDGNTYHRYNNMMCRDDQRLIQQSTVPTGVSSADVFKQSGKLTIFGKTQQGQEIVNGITRRYRYRINTVIDYVYTGSAQQPYSATINTQYQRF